MCTQDIDLDYWGGAAGPLQPRWETATLSRCGEALRWLGPAAWGDERGIVATSGLWPALLEGSGTGAWQSWADGRTRPSNGSHALFEECERQLSRLASSDEERTRLRLARALGLSVPEALAAVAAFEPNCAAVEESKLTALLSGLPVPTAVTIARSIDGFMPFHCVEPVEAAVLRAVRRAFNRTLAVSYSGCASTDKLRALRRKR